MNEDEIVFTAREDQYLLERELEKKEDKSIVVGDQEHYRAMQQIGKASVRFLLFLGESHGLRKLTHKRRKMEEELYAGLINISLVLTKNLMRPLKKILPWLKH